MIRMTQEQADALYQVYLKWQNHTPQCTIMPEKFEIVPATTRFIGVWVGTPTGRNPGSIFLGIEPDGHCHS